MAITDLSLLERAEVAVDEMVMLPFVRQLIGDLVGEVEKLRTELAFARDGLDIRPMTAVESNLMTQVLDLRRQLAEAKGVSGLAAAAAEEENKQ